MVEMMGVEPMSESISTEFSPSAAFVYIFASFCVQKQTQNLTIPCLKPTSYGNMPEVFLYDLMPHTAYRKLVSNTQTAYAAANAKVLAFLAFIFNLSS